MTREMKVDQFKSVEISVLSLVTLNLFQSLKEALKRVRDDIGRVANTFGYIYSNEALGERHA